MLHKRIVLGEFLSAAGERASEYLALEVLDDNCALYIYLLTYLLTSSVF